MSVQRFEFIPKVLTIFSESVRLVTGSPVLPLISIAYVYNNTKTLSNNANISSVTVVVSSTSHISKKNQDKK